MDGIEGFLNSYSTPLIWILSSVLFFSFVIAFGTVAKAIWKYFKRGVYVY